MFNATQLQEKWSPVLNHGEAPEIQDRYKRAVTSVLLENQERALREERGMINEVAVNSLGASTITPAGSALASANTAGLAGFDPVLISLVRRAMPNLMAYDVCGVQPMSGPSGLIFAMRSRYENQGGEEALFNEPDAQFTAGLDATAGAYDPSTKTAGDATDALVGTNPGLLNDGGTYEATRGFSREDLEQAGDAGKLFREMSFSIEKTSVTASPEHSKLSTPWNSLKTSRRSMVLTLSKSSLTSCLAKFSLRSTVKLSVVYTALLSLVLRTTLLTLASSTSTLTPTDVGRLKSSKVFSSKSREMLTLSPKTLVEERATS